MSKVDWQNAPEGAQYYANKAYWKNSKVVCGYLVLVDGIWLDPITTLTFSHSPFFYNDVQSKEYHITDANKKDWPDESRIDIIGTNGNTGEAYVHYDEFREKCATGPSVYDKVPIGKMREAVEAQEKEREQQALLGIIGSNKYQRDIVGLDGTKTTVDVYRVLDAFKTGSAAIDHAVKKLLAPGLRHSKDRKQDLQEAIDSIAAELLLMSQK